MIFLEKILTCGLSMMLFWTYIMAQCTWRNGHYPGEQGDRDCTTTPYIVDCKSTVVYDRALPLCLAREAGWIHNYSIVVNLEDPVESPFHENATFNTGLTIQNGYLVTIPKDIYNMPKLTDLKISRNKLRKINFNDFITLNNLRTIDLTYNKIIVIETAEKILSDSAVQDIDVSFNIIEVVPKNFVKRFIELEHLNMSHNMISSVDEHAFEGTVQLKTLDLSHNRLREVGNIFVQLPNLIDLNYVNPKNLQKLSKLVLDENFIVHVNFTEFFDTGIPELSIGRNLIPCNELARVKYSGYRQKFDRFVTANVFDFSSENIDGIPCKGSINDNTDIISVSDNPNSSILVSLLKNAIDNNSKSVDTVLEIVNRNENKLEQLIKSTNSMLSNLNNQLTDIRNNLPDKNEAEIADT